jgi:hypothetical protein
MLAWEVGISCYDEIVDIIPVLGIGIVSMPVRIRLSI